MSNRLAYATGPERVYDAPLADILAKSRQGEPGHYRDPAFLDAAAQLKRLCSLRETLYNKAAADRAYWLLRVNQELGFGQTRMNRLFGNLSVQQWNRIRAKMPAELPHRDGDPETEAAAVSERFGRALAAVKRARTLRAHLIKLAADTSAELGRPKRVGLRHDGSEPGSVRFWAEVFGVKHQTVHQIARGALQDVSWLEDRSQRAQARVFLLEEPDPPPGPLPGVPDWDPAARSWGSFTQRQRAAFTVAEAPDYDTSGVVFAVVDGQRVGWLRPVFTSTGNRWGYRPRSVDGAVAPEGTIRSSRGDAVAALFAALDVARG